jgi:hypothetical protein
MAARKRKSPAKPSSSPAPQPAPVIPLTPFDQRQALYNLVERERGSRVICYVTGDRKNMETQISHEVVKLFVAHLDELFASNPSQKISLILYTKGGNTLAAWSLVNTLRMFCENLEIIVPAVAQSAGTLMCLGANRVVMTKQAMLGPIDPSITGPLNPALPGAPGARAPVSVEAIKGYIDMAKKDFGVKDLTPVLIDLAGKVHPLVLGGVFRTRSQIQTLAEQFLKISVTNAAKRRAIIDFLCGGSGSHDYTINRREARELGLAIENCGEALYGHLKQLQGSIDQELELNVPFDPASLLAGQQAASYRVIRCIIESTAGPSHIFASEGTLTKTQMVPPGTPGPVQEIIQDQRTFEGWRLR